MSQTIKVNKVFSLIKTCTNEHAFSILKAIQLNKTIGYRHIQKFTGMESSAVMGYYMRKLKGLHLIEKNPYSPIYKITPRGTSVIKMIEEYLTEKFIGGEEMNCRNNTEGIHDYITVCRKCSFIKKEEN